MDQTQILQTSEAPAAIGPYSQGIIVNTQRLVFCSGQIALSPETGQLVSVDDVRGQTAQVLANLRAVLAAAGATYQNVVKTTIFLTDLADFAVVNELYGRCFSSAPPARSTVQVAALPRGARVEIEAIAAL